MTEIKVPDIGDFDGVEVIELLVAEGDQVEAEQPLVVLESDKATMEVPATEAGTIDKLLVKIGDKVSEGDAVASLKASGDAPSPPAPLPEGEGGKKEASEPKSSEKQAKKPENTPKSAESAGGDIQCQVVVLGSGPGGYTAAFRAADLGLNTVLVERYPTLGGVCLNVGCIPSKALLHTAHIIEHAQDMAKHGVEFGKPKIDREKLLGFKNSVVGKLTGGLASMAKQRKVTVVHGVGQFSSKNQLVVEGDDGTQTIAFEHAIIAAGSESITLPFIPDDDRVIDSTGALAMEDIPKTMLVLGGGIIGLEMANVYAALGTEVDVVEMTDGLIPGADQDLVRPLQRKMSKLCGEIWVSTKVTNVEAQKKGLKVTFEGKDAPENKHYDKVLLSVGRRPNGHNIGADAAGIDVDERGFVAVDKQQRTNVDNIFAIGDIVGQPMLAHKATHEGKVAAEVIAGQKSYFDPLCIPSVVYTDPEVAWTGVTETEAKEKSIAYEKGQFPWAANGRSLGMGNEVGFTRLLFDKNTHRIIGGAAVGPNAGELVAEMCLAIEMGCDMEDIGLTIHPHPTLTESIGMAAEVAEGTITDLYLPKKK